MFLAVLFFLILGIVVGVVCGLLPGIHPNLVSVLLISFLVGFTSHIGPDQYYLYVAFIVAVSITNVIVNFIPTVFLSVPGSGIELGVLPGHRMLLRGEGPGAVRLGIMGAFGGVLFSLSLFPLIILTVPKIYALIEPNLHIILSALVLFFIFKDREPMAAASLFFLSGCLGLISEKLPINQDLILFPLLTGLFGLSMLVLSIKKRIKIPPQQNELFISNQTIVDGIVRGSFGGITTGVLPGIGASAAAMLFSSESVEEFLITIGAIAGVNTLFSFLALWLIGKARSGAAATLQYFTSSLTFSDCVFIIFVSLICLSLAVLLTDKISSLVAHLLNRVNYSLLSLVVLLFTLYMVLILTGVWGIALSLVSCIIGIIPNLSRVRRIHLMGALLLPTILFYAGFTF